MEVYDVSVPVRPGMIRYPGDPDVRLELVESIAAGAAYNLSRLELGVHAGTHVDAPLHVFPGGASVDELPLDALVGPARIVDATGAAGLLGAAELDALALPAAERVLFKTRNSELWDLPEASEEFVALAPDGAAALIDRGVRLVGVDYLSVGDEAVHGALLGAGVVVVEGLDLRAVRPGAYELVCAPLKLAGAEGAPARVFLLRSDDDSRAGAGGTPTEDR